MVEAEGSRINLYKDLIVVLVNIKQTLNGLLVSFQEIPLFSVC